MTPGERADKALTLIYRSGGELGYMLIKRRLRRSGVMEVIQRLELALEDLKKIVGPV